MVTSIIRAISVKNTAGIITNNLPASLGKNNQHQQQLYDIVYINAAFVPRLSIIS